MRHWLALLLLTTPAVGEAREAADPLKPQGFRQPSTRELAQCKELQWIDYRRLGAMAAGEMGSIYAPETATHAAVRGSFAFPHPEGATVTISTVIGSGETQEVPTSTSSVIWRDKAGVWRYDRVDRDERTKESRQDSGLLAPDLAASVDKALADPCFALEPDYLPRDAPARDGQPGGFCYSYITSVVRIESAHGVRAMLQCNALDGYRAIANAAMYARSGPLR